MADFETLSKSAFCTNSSAFTLLKTHQGVPTESEPSVVFQAINPPSVPIKSKGPRPSISICKAVFTLAALIDNISDMG